MESEDQMNDQIVTTIKQADLEDVQNSTVDQSIIERLISDA